MEERDKERRTGKEGNEERQTGKKERLREADRLNRDKERQTVQER